MGNGWNKYRSSNKYSNIKTEIDGYRFDSLKEARRYVDLHALERVGEISDLQLQKTFELIPAQYEQDRVGVRVGIIKGKCIEKACTYKADFVYIDNNGNVVVEDVKGVRTDVYKIKKKLMLYIHGIRIKEV